MSLAVEPTRQLLLALHPDHLGIGAARARPSAALRVLNHRSSSLQGTVADFRVVTGARVIHPLRRFKMREVGLAYPRQDIAGERPRGRQRVNVSLVVVDRRTSDARPGKSARIRAAPSTACWNRGLGSGHNMLPG